MKTDTTKATVAAVDWVAPDIKPSSQWSTPGTYASDVLRRNVDFHYRMPLWLAMPVGEAEKLRVTRIAMALTTTTTEASGGADASVALDDGTYVRVVRDGGADGGGATEALTVTTVTGSVRRVDVYAPMTVTRTSTLAEAAFVPPVAMSAFEATVAKAATAVWAIALVVACLTATGCQHLAVPPGDTEVDIGGLLSASDANGATKSPETEPRLSSEAGESLLTPSASPLGTVTLFNRPMTPAASGDAALREVLVAPAAKPLLTWHPPRSTCMGLTP